MVIVLKVAKRWIILVMKKMTLVLTMIRKRVIRPRSYRKLVKKHGKSVDVLSCEKSSCA